MELLQFSTSWCGPCKAMRRYVTTKYNADEINYKFIDIEQDEGYYPFIAALNIRSVPVLAVVANDEILATVKGVNTQFIDKYVEIFYQQKLQDEEE